jgi:2-dehydro-3-deoxygluconokinase
VSGAAVGGSAPPARGARVVALGEILLRLKSPGHERLFQTPVLEATFGGAEANVVMSLAGFGVPAAMATVLPEGPLGDAAVAELRRGGVDTRQVVRQGDRLGVYYLETGAAHRPSRVIYDRAGSAFATAGPQAFDWDAVFAGAGWFHVSGITPAVSASAARLCLAAATAARARGLTVSCDYNYRATLWRYGSSAPEVMRDIMHHVDVGIAGREDCQRVLGVPSPACPADLPDGGPNPEHYRALAERTLAEFPSLQVQVITLRESHSASRNGWSACLFDGTRFVTSRRYEITDMVDRVGAGDAFSAGFLYGLQAYPDAAAALEFATAASCLKHSIPGDVNRVTVAEVEALLYGDGGGRVQR